MNLASLLNFPNVIGLNGSNSDSRNRKPHTRRDVVVRWFGHDCLFSCLRSQRRSLLSDFCQLRSPDSLST